MIDVQGQIDKVIAEVNSEIDKLITLRNRLEIVQTSMAEDGNKAVEVLPKPMRDMAKMKEEYQTAKALSEVPADKPVGVKVRRQGSWDTIKEAFRLFKGELLTVTQVAELTGLPRTCVSYHTSQNKHKLYREKVSMHSHELKMTLRELTK